MVFLKGQIVIPSVNKIGDDYAYNQVFKSDKKNIDKNIVKHSEYVEKVLKDKLFDNKKNKNK